MSHRPKETAFKIHPQIERYTLYRDHIHKNLRWNASTISLAVIFGGLVPLFIFTKLKQNHVRRYEYEGREGVENVNLFDLVRQKPMSDEERRLKRARRFKEQYDMAMQMDIDKKLEEEKKEVEREAPLNLAPQNDLAKVRTM